MKKIPLSAAFFVALLFLGCYTNPRQKADAAKREHQALQNRLARVSGLDSVICKTVSGFKLPSCFWAPQLFQILDSAQVRRIEKCTGCKPADSLFLAGKEYYSLTVELRKTGWAPPVLYIGYTFLSSSPEKHGLGISYDLIQSKDSLIINHDAVPKQWMD